MEPASDYSEDAFNGLETNTEKRNYLIDRGFRRIGTLGFGDGVGQEEAFSYWQPGLVTIIEQGSHAEYWSKS